MSTRLTRTDAVDSGDQFTVAKGDSVDYRLLSQAGLLSWIQSNFASPDFTKQKVTPSDGFTVTMTQDGTNSWLLIVPPSAISSGTIELPAATVAADGQELIFTTTRQIPSLSVTCSGGTVTGAPSAIAANGSFRLKYDLSATTWFIA